MIFMVTISMYALFGDDLRLAVVTINYDSVFFIMTSITCIIFILEILISCFVIKDYFLSFYFWLDMLASFSMILDIGWIWDQVLGT